MYISVIIPVFNEEKNILILHSRLSCVLNPLKDYSEIIYVNDGSSDKSVDIIKTIQNNDKRVKLINLDKHYSQSTALDAGFRNAEGDIILTIDADLQNDPQDFLRILDELKNNDIVCGYRINRLESDGVVKFISSQIANYVRNKLLRENFKDVGCFLRGFRKECIKNFNMYGDFHIFIISVMNMNGYKIKEIPVKSYPRQYGKSNYNIRNRLLKNLISLLVVKWMKNNRITYEITKLT